MFAYHLANFAKLRTLQTSVAPAHCSESSAPFDSGLMGYASVIDLSENSFAHCLVEEPLGFTAFALSTRLPVVLSVSAGS